METSTSSTRSSDVRRNRGGYVPPRLLLVLVAIGLGLVAAGTLQGAPGPPGPFAAGDGKAFAYGFEFGAVRSRVTGELRGSGTFTWNRRPRGSVEVRVTCLEIDGKTAVVGGRIVRRTGRRVPKRFRHVFFSVGDRSSAGRADRIRLQLRSAPADCRQTGTPALSSIRSGDIAVGDGAS
jgi:hypothetical protein